MYFHPCFENHQLEKHSIQIPQIHVTMSPTVSNTFLFILAKYISFLFSNGSPHYCINYYYLYVLGMFLAGISLKIMVAASFLSLTIEDLLVPTPDSLWLVIHIQYQELWPKTCKNFTKLAKIRQNLTLFPPG